MAERVLETLKEYVETDKWKWSAPQIGRDSCLVCIKALEKQIPKKPIIVETDMEGMDMETGEEYTYKMDEAHCINCDSVIGNEYNIFDEHYCRICGQKIDWLCWE